MTCPSDDALYEYVLGRATAQAASDIEGHMADCAACQAVVAHTATFLYGGREDGPVDDEGKGRGRPPLLAPGDRVQRYVIAEAHGAGAAGIVYRAFDPQLGRTVALKIIPRRPAEGMQTATIEEARALARLSHPNIVAVYDAGLHEGHVYIVMEWVEGGSLESWLRQHRPWRQVVEALLGAARGLAAAHDADLVHRDFKPTNVLVGHDGRVRVADFGLALPSLHRAAGDEPPGGSSRGPESLAGTLPYLAPELLAGAPASAASDQFSFCVALFVALHGVHPLEDADMNEGSRATWERWLSRPRLRPIPADGIPAAVDRALAVGLRPSPADRHPSMHALVAALERALQPARPWRWIAPASGAALAAAMALVALVGARPAAPVARCGDGIVHGEEECDDGNAADDDGCLSTCRRARCGDGVVRSRVEECDDGNAVNDDGCTTRCLACPPGANTLPWIDGHCYTRHEEALPFAQAEVRCQQQAGHLVTYNTQRESLAVVDAMVSNRAPAWIGVSRTAPGQPFGLVSREPFKLVSREPFKFSWWQEGEPRDDRDCVLQAPGASSATADPGMAVPAVWRSEDCQQPAPYICERSGWELSPSTNHAYLFQRRSLNHERATAVCERHGAHLVTITDEEEQAFVLSLRIENIWLGALKDADKKFGWSTGEPFAFSRFGPGEPDGARDQCLVLDGGGIWHDRLCVGRYEVLCEVD